MLLWSGGWSWWKKLVGLMSTTSTVVVVQDIVDFAGHLQAELSQ